MNYSIANYLRNFVDHGIPKNKERKSEQIGCSGLGLPQKPCQGILALGLGFL